MGLCCRITIEDMGLCCRITIEGCREGDLVHYISPTRYEYGGSNIACSHCPGLLGGFNFLHRSNGSTARPGPVLGESLFRGGGPLSSISNAVLGLAVLSQVEGSNLLGLFNLLLVRLDLALELVNQSLHPLMVLAVLILLVGQLLDPPLGLAHVLLGVALAPVLSIKLGLQLTDAGIHLGHGLLSSLEGVGLGLINTRLHVLHLGLEELMLPFKLLGEVLLSAELISQPSGIDHGTLGLLLRQTGLAGHLIQVSSESSHLSIHLLLASLDRLVGAGLVREGFIAVSELLLHHAAGTVGLLQQGARLLQSVLVGVALAVSRDEGIMSLLLGNLLSLKPRLGVPQSFSVGSIGMLQAAVKIKHISL